MRTARRMTRIKTADEYLQRVKTAARDARARVIADPTPLVARVNHGRLMANCPSCGAGIAIEPGWHGAGCMDDNAECYRWFQNVVIPDNLSEIDAVLKQRPRVENRNWEPGETVAFLKAENDLRMKSSDLVRAMLEQGRK